MKNHLTKILNIFQEKKNPKKPLQKPSKAQVGRLNLESSKNKTSPKL